MSDREPLPTRRESEPAGHARSNHRHGEVACSSCEVGASAAPKGAPRGNRSFKVRGMDCAEEVSALKQAVGPVVGGAGYLAFDVLNGRMTVAHAAEAVPDEAIINAVAATGMGAVPWAAHAAKRSDADRHRRQQVWFTAASGAATALGLVLHVWIAGGIGAALRLLEAHSAQPTPWPAITAYALAVALGGRFVVVKAWYAARALRAVG